MKARFTIENPEEMQATIKITMSVKEWVDLCQQLDNKWPSSRLSAAISHVVYEANKTYSAEEMDALP